MTKVPTVSVWLESASGSFSQDMSQWILETRKKLGTVPLAPHVTAVGGFEFAEADAADRVMALAQQIAPIEVTFTDIGYREAWNQSAFLMAQPTQELRDLYERSIKAFDMHSGHYMPHASLLYGLRSESNGQRVIALPEPARRAAIEALDFALPLVARFDRISLWNTDLENVAGWSKVADFALQGIERKISNPDALHL